MSPFILGPDDATSSVVPETPYMLIILQLSHQSVTGMHSGVPSIPRVPCQHDVTQLSDCIGVCICVCAVALLSIITLQPHKEKQQMVREKQPEEVPERACTPSLTDTKPSLSVSYT